MRDRTVRTASLVPWNVWLAFGLLFLWAAQQLVSSFSGSRPGPSEAEVIRLVLPDAGRIYPWYVYHAQVRGVAQEEWEELRLEAFSPKQTLGAMSRVETLLAQGSGSDVRAETLRAQLAGWLAWKWHEIYPGNGGLAEVRFLRSEWPLSLPALAKPRSAWLTPPLQGIPEQRLKLLGTYRVLGNGSPGVKQEDGPIRFIGRRTEGVPSRQAAAVFGPGRQPPKMALGALPSPEAMKPSEFKPLSRTPKQVVPRLQQPVAAMPLNAGPMQRQQPVNSKDTPSSQVKPGNLALPTPLVPAVSASSQMKSAVVKPDTAAASVPQTPPGKSALPAAPKFQNSAVPAPSARGVSPRPPPQDAGTKPATAAPSAPQAPAGKSALPAAPTFQNSAVPAPAARGVSPRPPPQDESSKPANVGPAAPKPPATDKNLRPSTAKSASGATSVPPSPAVSEPKPAQSGKLSDKKP